MSCWWRATEPPLPPVRPRNSREYAYRDPVEIRLLGPLDAVVEDREVRIGPPRQRAVLAMLALAAPAVVSTERFVDGISGVMTRPVIRVEPCRSSSMACGAT